MLSFQSRTLFSLFILYPLARFLELVPVSCAIQLNAFSRAPRGSAWPGRSQSLPSGSRRSGSAGGRGIRQTSQQGQQQSPANRSLGPGRYSMPSGGSQRHVSASVAAAGATGSRPTSVSPTGGSSSVTGVNSYRFQDVPLSRDSRRENSITDVRRGSVPRPLPIRSQSSGGLSARDLRELDLTQRYPHGLDLTQRFPHGVDTTVALDLTQRFPHGVGATAVASVPADDGSHSISPSGRGSFNGDVTLHPDELRRMGRESSLNATQYFQGRDQGEVSPGPTSPAPPQASEKSEDGYVRPRASGQGEDAAAAAGGRTNSLRGATTRDRSTSSRRNISGRSVSAGSSHSVVHARPPLPGRCESAPTNKGIAARRPGFPYADSELRLDSVSPTSAMSTASGSDSRAGSAAGSSRDRAARVSHSVSTPAGDVGSSVPTTATGSAAASVTPSLSSAPATYRSSGVVQCQQSREQVRVPDEWFIELDSNSASNLSQRRGLFQASYFLLSYLKRCYAVVLALFEGKFFHRQGEVLAVSDQTQKLPVSALRGQFVETVSKLEKLRAVVVATVKAAGENLINGGLRLDREAHRLFSWGEDGPTDLTPRVPNKSSQCSNQASDSHACSKFVATVTDLSLSSLYKPAFEVAQSLLHTLVTLLSANRQDQGRCEELIGCFFPRSEFFEELRASSPGAYSVPPSLPDPISVIGEVSLLEALKQKSEVLIQDIAGNYQSKLHYRAQVTDMEQWNRLHEKMQDSFCLSSTESLSVKGLCRDRNQMALQKDSELAPGLTASCLSSLRCSPFLHLFSILAEPYEIQSLFSPSAPDSNTDSGRARVVEKLKHIVLTEFQNCNNGAANGTVVDDGLASYHPILRFLSQSEMILTSERTSRIWAELSPKTKTKFNKVDHHHHHHHHDIEFDRRQNWADLLEAHLYDLEEAHREQREFSAVNGYGRSRAASRDSSLGDGNSSSPRELRGGQDAYANGGRRNPSSRSEKNYYQYQRDQECVEFSRMRLARSRSPMGGGEGTSSSRGATGSLGTPGSAGSAISAPEVVVSPLGPPPVLTLPTFKDCESVDVVTTVDSPANDYPDQIEVKGEMLPVYRKTGRPVSPYPINGRRKRSGAAGGSVTGRRTTSGSWSGPGASLSLVSKSGAVSGSPSSGTGIIIAAAERQPGDQATNPTPASGPKNPLSFYHALANTSKSDWAHSIGGLMGLGRDLSGKLDRSAYMAERELMRMMK